MEKAKVEEAVPQEVVEVEQPTVYVDEYSVPELKEEDKPQDPGHSSRAFRS